MNSLSHVPEFIGEFMILYNKHIVKMSHLPESVYFAQELCLLLLMA